MREHAVHVLSSSSACLAPKSNVRLGETRIPCLILLCARMPAVSLLLQSPPLRPQQEVCEYKQSNPSLRVSGQEELRQGCQLHHQTGDWGYLRGWRLQDWESGKVRLGGRPNPANPTTKKKPPPSPLERAGKSYLPRPSKPAEPPHSPTPKSREPTYYSLN